MLAASACCKMNLSARRKAVRHTTDKHALVAGRRVVKKLPEEVLIAMLGATYQEIATCAYQIWQQEGRPEGRALDHWLQAELQLVLSSILQEGGTPKAGSQDARAKAAATPKARSRNSRMARQT